MVCWTKTELEQELSGSSQGWAPLESSLSETMFGQSGDFHLRRKVGFVFVCLNGVSMCNDGKLCKEDT